MSDNLPVNTRDEDLNEVTEYIENQGELDYRRDLVYKWTLERKSAPQILKLLHEYEEHDFSDCNISDVISDLRTNQVALQARVKRDPYYLDKSLEHLHARIDELVRISAQLWTEFDDLNDQKGGTALRAKILGQIQDNTMQIAKLQKLDTKTIEIVQKVKQAEQAQQNVIAAIADIIRECPRCSKKFAILIERGEFDKGFNVDVEDADYEIKQ